MPGSERSLRVTDAYRARLIARRTEAVAAAAIAWRRIRADDLDATFREWLAMATATTAGAQRATVTLGEAYVAAYLATELGRAQPVAGTGVRGTPGRPLADKLATALLVTRAGLRRSGVGRDAALRLGLAHATRTVSVEVTAASREAVDAASRNDDRIIGWRRATTGNACGACLGLADGDVEPVDEPLEVHPHDRCVKELVVGGVVERHRRATGPQLFEAMSAQQQDHLFHGRGGAEKAELIRAGAATLSDLVHRSPRRAGPDVITEAPLAALTA